MRQTPPRKVKCEKLPILERKKIIRLTNNMMHIPKQFLDYLNWEITCDLIVELVDNGIMVKRRNKL